MENEIDVGLYSPLGLEYELGDQESRVDSSLTTSLDGFNIPMDPLDDLLDLDLLDTYCDHHDNGIVFDDNIDLHSNSDSVTSSKGLSKNAINARENRRKKKEYVTNLENVIKKLNTDNRSLKSNVENLSEQVNELQNEVLYLKSVISNESELAAVIKNVTKVPGLHFIGSPSMFYTKSNSDNHDTVMCNSAMESNDQNDNIIHRCAKSGRVLKRKFTTDKTENAAREESDIDRMCRFDNAKDDHLYAKNVSAAKNTSNRNHGDATAGVCVHVTGSNVSLEFCPRCNGQSSKRRMPLNPLFVMRAIHTDAVPSHSLALYSMLQCLYSIYRYLSTLLTG